MGGPVILLIKIIFVFVISDSASNDSTFEKVNINVPAFLKIDGRYVPNSAAFYSGYTTYQDAIREDLIASIFANLVAIDRSGYLCFYEDHFRNYATLSLRETFRSAEAGLEMLTPLSTAGCTNR